MKPLFILEGNCYLHAGEANYSKGFNYLGFPTSGIYHLMQKICNLELENKAYAVVFDSPSFRKSLDSGYKLSRKVNNKILVQSKVIVPNLRRAGVNVIQIPEFEGDDLVYNLVQANKDRESIIFTCDYDVAMNVCSHARIVGCRKDFPSINRANFQFIVSRDGRQIPYNTVGMEKVIFGCDSDEISGIGKDDKLIWKVFNVWWKKNYKDKDKVLIVDEKACRYFVLKYLPAITLNGKKISQETISNLERNIPLVFPRVLTDDEITRNNIKLTEFSGVDGFALMDICRLFGMKKLYKMMNKYFVEDNNPAINEWLSDNDKNSTKQLTEKEKNWVLSVSSKYKQNGYAIEAGIPIDTDVSYHGNKSNTEYDGSPRDLDSDYDEVSNGANVGEF